MNGQNRPLIKPKRRLVSAVALSLDERINGMVGVSLNARKFCLIHLVWDGTFLRLRRSLIIPSELISFCLLPPC